MRDYFLFHETYGDKPISQVETWRLEAIAAGNCTPRNEGLNGIAREDLLERIRIELVARSLGGD